MPMIELTLLELNILICHINVGWQPIINFDNVANTYNKKSIHKLLLNII